ncbi:MAG TPA: phosphoadenylyl-sulfate reductase [Rhodanobacteraceae bacterium]|nr:phosphoadenylyl-sulfate reductase [Rhodanobacteraceae bacterium]
MNTQFLKDAEESPRARAELNDWLGTLKAEQRVEWALKNASGAHVLSSSFGAQAAVSLHMLTSQLPSIPVVLIDTGYLFPETYAFVERLADRLSLNLKVYQSAISPARMESRHGKLWEQGLAGLDRYNHLRKVEPMQRALRELGAHSWFAGLRRDQSRSRANIAFAERRSDRWKWHPLADWSDREIGAYMKQHQLPYHPLWNDGYVSIGDVHSTARWQPGMSVEETRFFGLKRECGLHLAL